MNTKLRPYAVMAQAFLESHPELVKKETLESISEAKNQYYNQKGPAVKRLKAIMDLLNELGVPNEIREGREFVLKFLECLSVRITNKLRA